LIVGNFDANGEVNLANEYFDKSKWTNYHQYGKIMTPGQAIWLVLSISLFLGLLSYTMDLQRALSRRQAWTKPILDRISPAYIAGRLSRINSEITGARSHGDDTSTITFNSVR
jgi:hypothetical protein